MNQNRLFGTDPEVFVITADSKLIEISGNLVEELIPPASFRVDMGVPTVINENNKHVFSQLDGVGRIIEDGAAFEFNVSPTHYPMELFSRVNRLKGELVDFVRQFGNFNVSRRMSTLFNAEKYWENRGEEFQYCVIAGCDPDYHPTYYDEVGFDKKASVISTDDFPFRFAGGHLHIMNMSDNPGIYLHPFAPTVFDFTVGLINCMWGHPNDSDEKTRLQQYGRPGRHRIQKYSDTVNGFEYRPPSNQWLSFTSVVQWMLFGGSLAGTIVEEEQVDNFLGTFFGDIPTMWSTMINLDKKSSASLFANVLQWSVENSIITLDEIPTISIG